MRAITLAEDARTTTIEALTAQLERDATSLADLAHTATQKPTPVAIADALTAADLVTASAAALRALAEVAA